MCCLIDNNTYDKINKGFPMVGNSEKMNKLEINGNKLQQKKCVG